VLLMPASTVGAEPVHPSVAHVQGSGHVPLQTWHAATLELFINLLWIMHEITGARPAMPEAWLLYRTRGHDNLPCAWLHTFHDQHGHTAIPACTWGHASGLCDSAVTWNRTTAALKRHAVFFAPGLSSKLASYHTQFAGAGISRLPDGVMDLVDRVARSTILDAAITSW
jgi:hypothetical protein